MADAGSKNDHFTINCDDFQEFKEALTKMRIIDDRIINALNTTVPTESFKGQVNAHETCKGLHAELSDSYKQRDGLIKSCIVKINDHVKHLRDQRAKDPDDLDVGKNLRRYQTSLRLMQGELIVEDVIKEKSMKTFHERCRSHYRPPE